MLLAQINALSHNNTVTEPLIVVHIKFYYARNFSSLLYLLLSLFPLPLHTHMNNVRVHSLSLSQKHCVQTIISVPTSRVPIERFVPIHTVQC